MVFTYKQEIIITLITQRNWSQQEEISRLSSQLISNVTFASRKNHSIKPSKLTKEAKCTRKHSRRMCTAHLPTINALVATRCQYRWGGCPQVNKRSLEIVPLNVFSVLELCYEDVTTEWFLPCFYVVDKVVTWHWSTINLAYCAVNIEIYTGYRE